MLLVACESSELPAVSRPGASLDGDDHLVMKAVLEDLLRPEREQSIQRGRGKEATPSSPPLFLVFDVTAAVCEHDPAPDPTLPGCVGSWWLEHLSRLPGPYGRSAAETFPSRNIRSLPIRGDLGDDVVYIPANAKLRELVPKYPPRTAIVAFSAPVYPRAGSAVIAYRHYFAGGGFVGLERSTGRWAVAKKSGWIE